MLPVISERVSAALSRFRVTRARLAAALSVALTASAVPLLVLSSAAPAAGAVQDVARPQAQQAANLPAAWKHPDVTVTATPARYVQDETGSLHLAHLKHLAHIAHLSSLAAPGARATGATATPDRTPGGAAVVSSSFQACVIAAESGGDAQIWNASGHYGLYQFSEQTWVAAGGSPSLFGHASAAYQTQVFWDAYRLWGTSPWAPYDGCGGGVTTSSYTAPAGGSGAAAVALAWAETQAGKPYVWGGTGPYGYDCSGLVQAAYEHAGISLPRTTEEMVASGKLVQVSSPANGDLAFWFSGGDAYHVELWDNGRIFGAHDTGSVIGPMPVWGSPVYYRVA